MEPTITSGELAKEFGVTANTIRNWVREFAPHLSPSANPTGKRQRRFTARDAEVLRQVAALRSGAKPATQAEIQDALADLHFGEVDAESEPSPEVEPNEPTLLVTQAHVEALTMLLQRETQRADDAQRRVEELQREIGRLEGAMQLQQPRPVGGFWARLFGRK